MCYNVASLIHLKIALYKIIPIGESGPVISYSVNLHLRMQKYSEPRVSYPLTTNLKVCQLKTHLNKCIGAVRKKCLQTFNGYFFFTEGRETTVQSCWKKILLKKARLKTEQQIHAVYLRLPFEEPLYGQ